MSIQPLKPWGQIHPESLHLAWAGWARGGRDTCDLFATGCFVDLDFDRRGIRVRDVLVCCAHCRRRFALISAAHDRCASRTDFAVLVQGKQLRELSRAAQHTAWDVAVDRNVHSSDFVGSSNHQHDRIHRTVVPTDVATHVHLQTYGIVALSDKG